MPKKVRLRKLIVAKNPKQRIERVLSISESEESLPEEDRLKPDVSHIDFAKRELRKQREESAWVSRLIYDHTSFNQDLYIKLIEIMTKGEFSKKLMADLFNSARCPLTFLITQLNDPEVIGILLERKLAMSENECYVLIELAMASELWKNVKALSAYGPQKNHCAHIFSLKIYYMINHPDADLESMKHLITQLIADNALTVTSRTFLCNTLEHGKLEVVKMLLDCNVHQYTKRRFGHDVIAHVFANKNVNVETLLEGRQFNVNAKCGDTTALHLATCIESDANVQFLLRLGANPNIRDFSGRTPLFVSTSRKCVELLLHHGANVQEVAWIGHTIFDSIDMHRYFYCIMVAQLCLDQIQGVHITMRVRKAIEKRPTVYRFYFNCFRQIERIVKMRIHPKFRLQSLLLGPIQPIAKYFYDESIVKDLIFKCRRLLLNTYYLATIEDNIKKAFAMRSLGVPVKVKESDS